MPDSADVASGVKAFYCPVCEKKFEDLDPAVASGIRDNHVKVKHKEVN